MLMKTSRTKTHRGLETINRHFSPSLVAQFSSTKLHPLFTQPPPLFTRPFASLIAREQVPLGGQVAVSGTALLAAAGSTVLLNYCVTPYVHEITKEGENFTAMTANLFGMRTTTQFNLDQVVTPTDAKLSRPFCNFVANGTPMYIHGELFNDKAILKKLLLRPLTKSEQEGRSSS